MELRNECSNFTKNADGWISLHKVLNDSFKEMGDLVNWANAIETDLENLITNKKQIRNQSQAVEEDHKADNDNSYKNVKSEPIEAEDLV